MTGTLQSLLAGFDPELPLERAKTIPNTWYTNPEVARLERDAVFARSWQMVGRREQVANARRVPHREYRRRTDAGRARRRRRTSGRSSTSAATGPGRSVLKSAARSRSSAAATTAGPTTSRATSAALPEFDGVQDFAKEDNGLVPVAVAEWGPFVWVHLTQPREPVEKFLSPLPAWVESRKALDGSEVVCPQELRPRVQLEGVRR